MTTVLWTADFRRVEALPFREWSAEGIDTDALTRRLKTADGSMSLRPIQALALQEIAQAGGLLGAIGVGHGKTIISLLAPSVLEAGRPLLFLPAQLKRLTEAEILPEIRKHWRVSPALRIESYHELSNNPNLLQEYEPDLIIADECHRISKKGSARTKRIMRYFDQRPETSFVGLSGTITRKSLEDYWHLLLMALGDMAPIPLGVREMRQWALALDDGIPEVERPHIGALRLLCEAAGDDLPHNLNRGEQRSRVRKGYQRRLSGTLGVVATSDSGVGASLLIQKRTNKDLVNGRGEWIDEALEDLRDMWRTPGGEEITDAVDYWRKAREIALGFYYEWDWEEPNQEWLSARREWRRYVRRITQRNPRHDTEMLVTLACERGELNSREYREWIMVKGDANPKTRTVWCSDSVLLDAVSLAKGRDTILWFEQRAVGDRLKQLTDWPVFQGGTEANNLLSAHVRRVGGPCVASIRAHGIGVNLQAFNDGILLTPPSSGSTWEQLLGRTHRSGQVADEVTMTVYQHTREFQGAFERAVQNAMYIEESTGQEQKLNYASIA